MFRKCSGEILLIKHRARGTLLSQQSLAMSKHTMFIGKQEEETQQKRKKVKLFSFLFMWKSSCFAFVSSLQEVEAKLEGTKLLAQSCYCGD